MAAIVDMLQHERVRGGVEVYRIGVVAGVADECNVALQIAQFDISQRACGGENIVAALNENEKKLGCDLVQDSEVG